MTIKIRRAEGEDLAAVCEIYAAARSYMQKNGNPTQWKDGYPSRALLSDDIRKRQLYLCINPAAEKNGSGRSGAGGEILAVFVLAKGPDPCYARIEDGAWRLEGNYSVVHRIAVSEAARGKGIAKFCLDWAAEGAALLRIDTHADNLPMQRLIAKCGFQRAGIIYTEDGSPRIAYEKRCGRAENGKEQSGT